MLSLRVASNDLLDRRGRRLLVTLPAEHCLLLAALAPVSGGHSKIRRFGHQKFKLNRLGSCSLA
jgi:hypothetical protein